MLAFLSNNNLTISVWPFLAANLKDSSSLKCKSVPLFKKYLSISILPNIADIIKKSSSLILPHNESNHSHISTLPNLQQYFNISLLIIILPNWQQYFNISSLKAVL